jgi:Fur family transcriptional regulator, ferric uptake regulator
MARDGRAQHGAGPNGLDSWRSSALDRLPAQLRARRWRLTEERSIAARVIAAKGRAFTCAMLVDELRPLGVSRSTVYRTLRLLERLQVLGRVTLRGQPGYVACEAPPHHYHLVCGECFTVVHLDAAAIEAHIARVAQEQRHFRVLAQMVEVGGRCFACTGPE